MTSNDKAHITVQAFNILRALYQLSVELHASDNRQDLIFRVLNRTILVFPYRRAVLWSFERKKPFLLGISGREAVNRQSPLAALWEPLAASLSQATAVHILEEIPESLEAPWQALVEKTDGLSVMWVPIRVHGEPVAGLWLERWGGDAWDASECEVMNAYAQNLGLAWQRFSPKARRRPPRFFGKKAGLALASLMLVLLVYVPAVSLRVVAPCEIVPRDPEMVAAPINGVIKEVRVNPGDRVNAGDLLFVYEDRVIRKELEVARKQVEIIKCQYDRMRFKSFIDQEAMEEIQNLKYRLEQEEVRLRLAEANAGHVETKAPVGGVCMVDHPEDWQGRPVQIGERVVMIFKPDQSKVKIFLPEKDNIEFDPDRPVKVILNAAPARSYAADLRYVAPQASKGPNGEAYFLAEARWRDKGDSLKVGSKGTAVIYGDRVSVFYWLLRKPVAGVRHYLGL